MIQTIHLTADSRNLASLAHLVQDESSQVMALPDGMVCGPLRDPEGVLKFDSLRAKFWMSLDPEREQRNELHEVEQQAGNVAVINQISTLLSQNPDATILYWMAGNVIDVLGYFFVLHFLRTHYERIRVINIAGLPFLDDDFKMIFPERLASLNEKQLTKALNLARPITASEMEVEGEEWKILRDRTGLRILEGNRKIETKDYGYYDTEIKAAHKAGSKPERTAQAIVQKSLKDLPLSFVAWRLSTLVQDEEQIARADNPSDSEK